MRIKRNESRGISQDHDDNGPIGPRFYNTIVLNPVPDLGGEITRDQFSTITHHIKTGDKLYKLSQKHYGHPAYWWVIAWFNQKPTDCHFNFGDAVLIPFPLETAIYLATKEED